MTKGTRSNPFRQHTRSSAFLRYNDSRYAASPRGQPYYLKKALSASTIVVAVILTVSYSWSSNVSSSSTTTSHQEGHISMQEASNVVSSLAYLRKSTTTNAVTTDDDTVSSSERSYANQFSTRNADRSSGENHDTSVDDPLDDDTEKAALGTTDSVGGVVPLVPVAEDPSVGEEDLEPNSLSTEEVTASPIETSNSDTTESSVDLRIAGPDLDDDTEKVALGTTESVGGVAEDLSVVEEDLEPNSLSTEEVKVSPIEPSSSDTTESSVDLQISGPELDDDTDKAALGTTDSVGGVVPLIPGTDGTEGSWSQATNQDKSVVEEDLEPNSLSTGEGKSPSIETSNSNTTESSVDLQIADPDVVSDSDSTTHLLAAEQVATIDSSDSNQATETKSTTDTVLTDSAVQPAAATFENETVTDLKVMSNNTAVVETQAERSGDTPEALQQSGAETANTNEDSNSTQLNHVDHTESKSIPITNSSSTEETQESVKGSTDHSLVTSRANTTAET